VLTAADLEVNVLEFHQRSFQFDRVVELEGGPYAVFSRTETENERQLRPRLVRLTVVSPLAWIVQDAGADVLRISREGAAAPAPSPDAPAVEVAAEPSDFEEDGRRWRRAAAGDAGYLYAPAELATTVLGPEGRAALGLA
jgi:hypothetical protein